MGYVPKAMHGLTVEDLRDYASSFLLNHSLECLFFGNLTVAVANKMANAIIAARKDFLERHIKELDVKSDQAQELILEDWFKNDPVNQITMLENAAAQQNNPASAPPATEQEHNPSAAEEEEEAVDQDEVDYKGTWPMSSLNFGKNSAVCLHF